MLDGFGLTAETLLLSVVTPLSLTEDGVLALLILRHFVWLVLVARLAGAVGVTELGDVDLKKNRYVSVCMCVNTLVMASHL